ncbi:MAG: hypothetical protein AAF602_15815 [Myxococcota bacterium]
MRLLPILLFAGCSDATVRVSEQFFAVPTGDGVAEFRVLATYGAEVRPMDVELTLRVDRAVPDATPIAILARLGAQELGFSALDVASVTLDPDTARCDGESLVRTPDDGCRVTVAGTVLAADVRRPLVTVVSRVFAPAAWRGDSEALFVDLLIE